MDPQQASWLDQVAAINAIVLGWWREISQPATTSSGSVSVGTTGVSATLSPGLIVLFAIFGVALIMAFRK